ncbi:MAG: ABC transporter substrate-binding protein [Pigmentiphaga sp.]
MRRFKLSAKCLLALAPFMFGSTMAAETPQRGGEFVYSVSQGDPSTLDCHAGSSITTLLRVGPHYSTLLKVDPTNYPNIVGDVAKSWTVSDDGLVYTFKLHPDVKFHDGSKLEANDVKVTLDRMRAPPEGVFSARQTMYEDIVAVETPDPETVVVKLDKPNATMLEILAAPTGCIYSAKLLESDPDYPAKKVMGSGPFKFVSYTPGTEWVAERFEDYFIEGRPYLDRVRSLSLATPAMINAIASGQVMTDFRGMTEADAKRIQDTRGDGVKVYHTDGSHNLLLLMLPNVERPALADPRVRKALALSLDHWGGSKLVARSTHSNAPGGLLRPGSEFARTPEELSELPGYRKDMKAAREESRALLKEAGQENLKINFLNRRFFPYVGVFLIDQWRQIGVDVDHQQPEDPQFFARRDSGDFDVILSAFSDFSGDPTIQWNNMTSYETTPTNFGRFNDPKVDAYYEAQKREMDPAKRKAILQEAEAYILEQGYVIPFMWGNRVMVVDSKVQDYHVSPSNWVGLDMGHLWIKQ